MAFDEHDLNIYIGYWRIRWMEVWAQKYVDLVVPGFIELLLEDDRLTGTFQFGTVTGWMDCRVRDVNGVTLLEWSWDGRNEADSVCGRGCASLVDGELVGRIFIHAGDDSGFKAARGSRPTAHLSGPPEQDHELRMPRLH